MMDYNNNDSQYIEEAKDLVINSIGNHGFVWYQP